ncbi:hypothetical protein HCH_02990 [Hahella chejuensis KCTC 2396]|uniref:PsbP C-terminal domain-containing protein n=1 Tax=Hahella chejuensis (strain KCTC 2396) TaxID=349521 RepID=Q2SHW5_HAHCH|nr:hypothetical protein [Hahella chejuensis]ABC29759.1 hypothetical protein HCH_02990 [Hahella chejuensis KCTC 2396]
MVFFSLADTPEKAVNRVRIFIVLSTLFLMVSCGGEPLEVKTYTKDGLTMTIPGSWRATEDSYQTWGTRFLSFDAVDDAIVNVEIYTAENVRDLKKEDNFGLQKLVKQYNRLSDSFLVAASEKSEPVFREISRLGLNGIEQSGTAKFLDIDASYVKEFYLVNKENGEAFFIAVEASPDEHKLMNQEIDLFLSKLIEN